MSFESGKYIPGFYRDPIQEIFDANQTLISEMRVDMVKIAKKWFDCVTLDDNSKNFVDVFLFHCPQYLDFESEHGIEPIKTLANILRCNGWEVEQ
jgi:hypothetical protein